VNRLPPDVAEMMVALLEAGDTHREVARKTGVSKVTVGHAARMLGIGNTRSEGMRRYHERRKRTKESS
jgi:uncharacterized protein YerC